ncbi:hypothetical protein RFI_31718, partial [Reticulomyxa filosa]
NDVGMIGGNGYTICSGSNDNTIRIWDIETTKQLNVFKGHEDRINSVKYGSNELLNTILSGSSDKSIRLWDIRSGKQIQEFNGHTDYVACVEYSPFVIKNIGSNLNVICSGSLDNTIRFCDIRSNKKELYVIEGSDDVDVIFCLKFILLKKKVNNNEQKLKDDCSIHLCYGSSNGQIYALSMFVLISIFKIIFFKIWSFLIFFFHNEKEKQFIYEFMYKLLDVSNGLKKRANWKKNKLFFYCFAQIIIIFHLLTDQKNIKF